MENKSCCQEEKGCCGGYCFKKSKCFSTFITIFLISISLASLSWAWATMQKASTPVSGAPTLSVSAEGKVTVKPDLVKLNFSVVSQGENYASVQEDSDKKMAEAVDYLKELGVEEMDIKTVGYNLTPNYDYDWCRASNEIYRPCPPKIVSYTLRQQVESKIRDISKTGEVLSNLPNKGVNEIYSPIFTIDDPEQFKAEAREMALDKAKEKAKMIAKDSGISLGKIVSFSENDSFFGPVPMYKYSTVSEDNAGRGGSPIESGSQDISVTVTVSYEIK